MKQGSLKSSITKHLNAEMMEIGWRSESDRSADAWFSNKFSYELKRSHLRAVTNMASAVSEDTLLKDGEEQLLKQSRLKVTSANTPCKGKCVDRDRESSFLTTFDGGRLKALVRVLG